MWATCFNSVVKPKDANTRVENDLGNNVWSHNKQHKHIQKALATCFNSFWIIFLAEESVACLDHQQSWISDCAVNRTSPDVLEILGV